MPSRAKSTAPHVAPVKGLTPTAAKALAQTVRNLLPRTHGDSVDQLLIALHGAICTFCDFEQNPHKRRLPAIKKQLEELARAVRRLQHVLRGLSDMTLIEAGWYVDPEVERLERKSARGDSSCVDDDTSQTESSLTPTPPQNAYCETLTVLERLTQKIDSTLKWKERGGRPVRIQQYVLAWEVHDAMRQHLNIQPTTTAGGKFEKLLEACMRAGLTTIGTENRLPRNFRPYAHWAIHIRRQAAGTKPTPK